MDAKEARNELYFLKRHVPMDSKPDEAIDMAIDLLNRKMGYWIRRTDTYMMCCSQCFKEYERKPFNYCPNCGAKMED